jgi:hypothetical protein
MTTASRMVLCVLAVAGMTASNLAQSPTPTPEPEGRVTSIFHDVQLLPAQADRRAAAINDKVDEGTALRTGGDSRSELTFADLTITRLGENTIFSFNRAGRSVRLDSGSILLYARKNSGAAEISTKAVSVGITGTTVIFESKPASYDRLIVLEGNARFSLNDYPDQSMEVHGGQLLNVNAGAKKLPKPGRVDLKRIMKTHPLLKNFPPLPSLDLILAAAEGRNPPPQPQPPIGVTGSQGGPSPVYLPSGPPSGPAPAPWWCCIDGKVVEVPEAQARVRGNQCYRSREEALAHCGKLCWVCIDGKVAQVQEAEARTRRAQCYGSEEEARMHCKGKTVWCCINGEVVQTTEADCRERGGQSYGSRKEARKNCRGAGPTSTPTPYHRPSPTPHPRPTPRPTIGHPGYPNKPPKPTPTPTPKKKKKPGSGYGNVY